MAEKYTGKGKKGEHEAGVRYHGQEPSITEPDPHPGQDPSIPEPDPHPGQEPSIPESKVPPKKGKK